MHRFVLVVDDDHSIREGLCELLGDEGHLAIGAANGQAALEVLERQGPPCLIFLDVMMPVMDGPAFRAAQLGRPNWRTIPVVVITAGDVAAASAMNADGVLAKPLNMDRLLGVVGQFCAGTAVR